MNQIRPPLASSSSASVSALTSSAASSMLFLSAISMFISILPVQPVHHERVDGEKFTGGAIARSDLNHGVQDVAAAIPLKSSALSIVIHIDEFATAKRSGAASRGSLHVEAALSPARILD